MANQFGRPKTYKRFQDRGMFVADRERPTQAISDIDVGGSPALREWVANNRENLMPPNVTFFHRALANYNDPRVLFYVLDALVEAMPSTYVRPGQLSAFLNMRRNQFYWTPIAVGRVLAGIEQAVIMAYYGYDEDDRFLPFAQGRDTISRYYVMDPKGGNEMVLWLMQCRRKMFSIAMKQQEADAHGEGPVHFGTGKAASVTYMDEQDAEGWLALPAVRSVDAYKAQAVPSGPVVREEVPVDPGIDFSNVPNDGSGVRIGG